MSEPSIDIARLRKITKEVQECLEKTRAEKEEKRKQKNDREAEERSGPIAKEIIEGLPSLLEEQARKGFYNAEVMHRIWTLTEKKVAEIVISFCEGQGLQVKKLRHSIDDFSPPGHYLKVYWDNPDSKT